QVRPLLPGAGGCFVLVTSRGPLSGLLAAEAARPVPVDLLSTVESTDLVSRRLGAMPERQDPDLTGRIVARCSGLPLALVIVAARMLGAAGGPDPAATGLDAFAGDDVRTDLRAVFSWSYVALSAGAARAFRLVGQCPSADITGPMLASLAAVTPEQAHA